MASFIINTREQPPRRDKEVRARERASSESQRELNPCQIVQLGGQYQVSADNNQLSLDPRRLAKWRPR